MRCSIKSDYELCGHHRLAILPGRAEDHNESPVRTGSRAMVILANSDPSLCSSEGELQGAAPVIFPRILRVISLLT